MIAGQQLRQIPLAVPPFPLPTGIEFRRMLNPAGLTVMVFSRPDIMAAGVADGFVGVMETGFDQQQLPLVLAMLEVASAIGGDATVEAAIVADVVAVEGPSIPAGVVTALAASPSFVSFFDPADGTPEVGDVTETPITGVTVDPGPGPGPGPTLQTSGASPPVGTESP